MEIEESHILVLVFSSVCCSKFMISVPLFSSRKSDYTCITFVFYPFLIPICLLSFSVPLSLWQKFFEIFLLLLYACNLPFKYELAHNSSFCCVIISFVKYYPYAGKALSMLGGVQLELQKLVDCYVSAILSLINNRSTKLH